MEQPATFYRRPGHSNPRADHYLTAGRKHGLIKTHRRGRQKANGALGQFGAEVLGNQRCPTNVALLRATIGPPRIDMGLGMPQLVALRLTAVPTKPPIPHER